MPEIKQDAIIREMLGDLCYRLRLADDLFDHTTDALLAAMNQEEFDAKAQATIQLNGYSQALQLIYTDFRHLITRRSVLFPAMLALWQWNEEDAEEMVTQTLERLHSIADGMMRTLQGELKKGGEEK